MAIKRHEFHRKSRIAVAMPCFADGTGFPSSVHSSSPAATVGSVVVSMLTVPTTSAQRLVLDGAPHDRSAMHALSGCHSSADRSYTRTTRALFAHLSPAPHHARVSTCTRLLEAV